MSPHRDVAAWCEDNPNHHGFAYHEVGSSAIRAHDGWAHVSHRLSDLSSVMARQVVQDIYKEEITVGFDWTSFVGGNSGGQFKFEKVGDEIKGRITKLDVSNKFDKATPVITLDTGDGERVIYCSTIMLQDLVAAESPQVGDLIGIRMTGVKDTGQPQPMKEFEVAVKREGAPAAAAAAPGDTRYDTDSKNDIF